MKVEYCCVIEMWDWYFIDFCVECMSCIVEDFDFVVFVDVIECGYVVWYVVYMYVEYVGGMWGN